MKESKFISDIYSVRFDEKSDGYAVSIAQDGILKSKALIELSERIIKFMDTYTDEDIEKINRKEEEEWYASMYNDYNHLNEPYHI